MTEDQFKKILAEAFAERSTRLNRKLAGQEARLAEHMNRQMLDFFGRIARHVDERIGALGAKTDERFDRVYIGLDNIKAQFAADREERAAARTDHRPGPARSPEHRPT